MKQIVLDLLAKLLLKFIKLYFSVLHHHHWYHSAVNTRVITGTANVLSNPTPLVVDVAFGNFRRLSCCYTDCLLQLCLTCNNGFINMENNFVLFYFHIK